MSLIAAVLSQTNKILGLLVNFTGSFPIATINTINTNTQPAAQATNTQTGLTNQGFTPTVAGRIDTTISSRMRAVTFRSKATVTNGPASVAPSFTFVNVGGPGVLHTLDFKMTGIHGAATVTITIDGNNVSSFNLGLEGSNLQSTNTTILRPDGFWFTNSTAGYATSTGANQPASINVDNSYTDIGWEFATSLVISVQGTSANGYQGATLNLSCRYSN